MRLHLAEFCVQKLSLFHQKDFRIFDSKYNKNKMKINRNVLSIQLIVIFHIYQGSGNQTYKSSSDLSAVIAVSGLISGDPGRPFKCFTWVKSTSIPASLWATEGKKNENAYQHCIAWHLMFWLYMFCWKGPIFFKWLVHFLIWEPSVPYLCDRTSAHKPLCNNSAW